jgi:hypothetical protein
VIAGDAIVTLDAYTARGEPWTSGVESAVTQAWAAGGLADVPRELPREDVLALLRSRPSV